MNNYIQTGTNNLIVSTCSTTQTLGAPWISIPESSLSLAIQPGSSWDASTSTVVGPPANYNLVGVGNTQIGIIAQGLANAVIAPITFTTAAGVTTSFANNQNNQHMLASAMVIWGSANWPSGYFLRDVNGNKTILTYADAVGLGQAMGNAILTAENKYDTLVAQIQGYVANGSPASDITSVVW